MARTSTYLNFANKTEEVFKFYQSIFGGEFIGDIARFGEMPLTEGQPALPESLKDAVMHIELAITGGHILMGSDAPAEFGFTVTQGNAVQINLDPDTREEAKRLFDAFAEGGTIIMAMQDVFWGAYFGSLIDKYGIYWMINCTQKAS
jgi:PhnB protein